MPDQIKKFSEDLLKDFHAALLKYQTEEVVSKIKAADAGTFKVIVSTSDEDRQGDTLDQSKWNLENYKQNPIVLWAHDYDEPPIGVCTNIYVEGEKLVAEGKFAPAELNPFAGQIAGLYEAGFIKTTSVGYIVHEDGDLELLEFSFVPVPANPYALSLRQLKELKLDMTQLVVKGLRFDIKSEQAGDRCEMPDGSIGVLAEDPNNAGKLVCVPTETEKSNENDGDMNNELLDSIKAEHARHGETVTKAVDEFKSIDDFKSAMDAECGMHFENCMKAIDEHYGKAEAAKAIDEFKSAFHTEHGNHVVSLNKAIDEYKAEAETAQSAVGNLANKIDDELERHAKAQMEICSAEMGEGENDEEKTEEKGQVAEELQEDQVLQEKYKRLDRAYDIFSAFCSAYLEDETPVEDFEKLLDEAVQLMKNLETKATGALAKHYQEKSGREISAKNKKKLKAIIKALEEHHTEHGNSTNTAIAALKDLLGPDEGNEGEEQKPPKTASAPKPKVEVRDIRQPVDAFEAFMASRRVLRTVDAAVGKALEDLNRNFKDLFPDRR